jgi:hypothetical protein
MEGSFIMDVSVCVMVSISYSTLHINKQKEVWGVALPNISQNWVNLCTEGLCIPGHVTHLFLQPFSSPTLSTFDLVTSFISAINLHWD